MEGILIVLIVLLLFGYSGALVSGYTAGGAVHLLLAVVLVFVVVRLLRGRSV